MDGQLSKKLKARMDKVAAMLLDIYQTLVDMQYLDPTEIIKGPHDFEEEVEWKMVELELDPAIIYLHSVLPYVERLRSVCDADFFQGSRFADFRKVRALEQTRDPLFLGPSGDYDEENGAYMRPWQTSLCALGNHRSVMIYDARKHHIWILDQECADTSDPGIRKTYENRPEPKNQNSFDHIQSRPAEHVLRDINKWFQTLEVLPGGERAGRGGGGYGEWNSNLTKPLYEKHGWPASFDARAFLVSQARAHAVVRAKYNSEEPLRKVQCFEGWIKHCERPIKQANEKIDNAKTKDEEWSARFELWQAEGRRDQNHRDLEKARQKAARLCPGSVCQKPEDLPLWESESLRREAFSKTKQLEQSIDWAEKIRDDPARKEEYAKKLKQIPLERVEASVYQEAFEASKAIAERLCSGRTFQKATGLRNLYNSDTLTNIEEIKDRIAEWEEKQENLQKWAAQLPEGDDLTLTNQEWRRLFKSNEDYIERERKDLERQEKSLAEHGNRG